MKQKFHKLKRDRSSRSYSEPAIMQNSLYSSPRRSVCPPTPGTKTEFNYEVEQKLNYLIFFQKIWDDPRGR